MTFTAVTGVRSYNLALEVTLKKPAYAGFFSSRFYEQVFITLWCNDFGVTGVRSFKNWPWEYHIKETSLCWFSYV